MRVGTLEAIWRYPVKSMAGESLANVDLAGGGLPGDRSWAVRDEERGGIRGAKKIPGLMNFSARFAKAPAREGSSPAEIRFPDASKASTSDPDIGERLSQALGCRLSLWPLLPADALDHYRRGAPTHQDIEQELRSIFGRLPEEPLPDLSTFPPELMEFESPPGSYFDAFPLTLLSRASLATMASRAPDSQFDVRRFRPNLLVAETAPDEEFPELAWQKRRLRIGGALLRISVASPRCVMVTHGHGDLPKDPGIMRALVRENGGNLGVYAEVEEMGTITAGDGVELID
jgi:uncharacterized protein YcbX